MSEETPRLIIFTRSGVKSLIIDALEVFNAGNIDGSPGTLFHFNQAALTHRRDILGYPCRTTANPPHKAYGTPAPFSAFTTASNSARISIIATGRYNPRPRRAK